MIFTVHTVESAPEASREILAGVEKSFGFIPNMLATMATSPSLLKAYTVLGQVFDESSLTAVERQIVLLTVSFENSCEYCMAAHTVIGTMQSVPANVLEAVRNGQPIPDSRLEALRRFAAEVVTSRGLPSEKAMSAFTEAGYGPQQVLEVVLGVGMKTLSNYTNHLAATPLDAKFARAAWSKAA